MGQISSNICVLISHTRPPRNDIMWEVNWKFTRCLVSQLPSGIPEVFPFFFSLVLFWFPVLMALPVESYQVERWLHRLVSAFKPWRRPDDSSLFDTAPRSLLLNPFRCARVQHRGIQRRTKPRAKKKGKKLDRSLLPPQPPSPIPSRTDAPVYHFIPKRLYTLKQTVETVIVRAQLSCTVHLLDCWGTKGPLLMRLAACEWEVRHPWPFPWLWSFNLPSTHPRGSDNTKQTPERRRGRKSQTLMALVLCVNPLLSACLLC